VPKPEGYPLPWCDELDRPYWQINVLLCLTRPGWREWQGKRPMAEIIPDIDNLLRRTATQGGLKPAARPDIAPQDR